MNDLQKAMENLRADEEMKQRTIAYVQHQTLRHHPSRSRHARLAIALCSFLLFFIAATGIGGYTLYAKPVSYISIDINPSVELALNYWNRIVSATPLNADGDVLLQDLELKNMYYTEAIDLLLTKATSYSSEDLSITVASDHADTLISGIESCHSYGLYRGHCSEADLSEHQEAHELGISVAKYQMYLQLVRYDPSLTVEDCAQMTMRQLRNLLQQYISEDNRPEDSNTSDTSSSQPETSNRPGNNHGSEHGNMKGHGHGNHS